MFCKHLSFVAITICFLLVLAKTENEIQQKNIKFDQRTWRNMRSNGYLALPRQGRSDNQPDYTCCGMPLTKYVGICPIGMECCPGLKKVLQKSGQRTIYSVCVADAY
ncbi:small cardioactive peptide-related peptide isoform X1 [Octopus sinensis]|uniref:Small cardioactive peptide-related peptide n=2 Tax=Octopus TaxID=6643 RepID=SCPRP_OCTVU|nr:small cardioactive peptide-related peptide isoform X1 [Octopus sinensis]Q2V2G5.1 RecName: Full=Small cardioactive peptide-related peptide; Short=oct-SCPRP; Flags: Precursor [Octopus vulgaris]BAE66649.1 small cardioactive peptide-related peptide [Octopus vulgaris]